jgi:epoxyqueuosine reductase
MKINFITDALPDKPKYITGFADMTGLLHENYKGYGYAISLARHLDMVIIDSISSGPNKAYFDHYNEVNRELAEAVQDISLRLTERGYENIPVIPTVTDDMLADDYHKTLRMQFSHKMAATRAGIGWIGKTDLLVTMEFGPRVRLASILLKERPFETGIPIRESQCGDCEICVINCPAQAATGDLWNIETDRDAFYNAFKCREKCRELSLANLNERISLCGICVSVCPRGRL